MTEANERSAVFPAANHEHRMPTPARATTGLRTNTGTSRVNPQAEVP